MHELDAAHQVVRIAEQECRKRKLAPKKIVLQLGRSSTYTQETLAYYYDIIKQSSELLSASSLVFRPVSGNDLSICEIHGKDEKGKAKKKS